jgi:hypothetical protein
VVLRHHALAGSAAAAAHVAVGPHTRSPNHDRVGAAHHVGGGADEQVGARHTRLGQSLEQLPALKPQERVNDDNVKALILLLGSKEEGYVCCRHSGGLENVEC